MAKEKDDLRADIERDVYEMVVKGADLQRVLSEARRLHWDLRPADAARLVREALERFREASDFAKAHPEVRFGEALCRYDLVFYTAMQNHDRRTAIAAQKNIDLLMGFRSPPRSFSGKLKPGDILAAAAAKLAGAN